MTSLVLITWLSVNPVIFCTLKLMGAAKLVVPSPVDLPPINAPLTWLYTARKYRVLAKRVVEAVNGRMSSPGVMAVTLFVIPTTVADEELVTCSIAIWKLPMSEPACTI